MVQSLHSFIVLERFVILIAGKLLLHQLPSLFLIAEPLPGVSIWDANHLQYISNISLDIFPRIMCMDLNGLIYVCDYFRIRILDPRKNYRKVQTLCCNGDEFANLCIDDRNRLMVIDNTKKQLKIF